MKRVRDKIRDGVCDDAFYGGVMEAVSLRVRGEVQEVVSSFSPVLIVPMWFVSIPGRGAPVYDFVLRRLEELR